MASIIREGLEFSAHQYADQTTAKYTQHAFYFVRFLIAFQLMTIWADDMYIARVVCWYAVFLSRSCSYRTIKTYFSGLAHFFAMHGLPNPTVLGGFYLQRLMQGIKRVKGDDVLPKRPITPAMLIEFHRLLRISAVDCSPACIALYCAMLIAFFGFFRKGNVTSTASSWMKDTHALRRSSIVIDYNSYTMWIKVTRTKTIQFGERVLWVPIQGLRGSPLDVIAIYLRMCTLIPASDDAHAFCDPSGSPLSHSVFVAEVKRLVSLLGMDPLSVAGHSFRRGGASFAAYSGVSDAFIKLQGDWKSNAYLAYIIIPLSQRTTVTELMLSKISGGDLGEEIYGGARV